ncbi:hypothetical protein [Agromyces sp. LHK192]|uniref:hypothetical protein n=1 Tax=Agromyces sp. LHK192 TaxID=2498704 RepID=UPI000FD73F82|nr:hypothetical protein [Agromyces sp. LHK192]
MSESPSTSAATAARIPDASPGAPRRARAGFVVLLLVIGVATGAVALLGGGASGTSAALPMTVVCVAVLAYIAAAAIGIRWMGWLWAGIGSLLVGLAEVLDLPAWVVLGATGVALAVVGLIRRSAYTLAQTLGGAVYVAVAVVALAFDVRVGLVVGGLALAAHAAWDFVHFRRDIVVNRSLALWCMGLDLVAGLGCVVLAIVG